MADTSTSGYARHVIRRKAGFAAALVLLASGLGAAPVAALDVPGLDIAYGPTGGGISILDFAPPVIETHGSVVAKDFGWYTVGSVDGQFAVGRMTGGTEIMHDPDRLSVPVPGIATDFIATPWGWSHRFLVGVSPGPDGPRPVVARVDDGDEPFGTAGVAAIPVVAAGHDVRFVDNSLAVIGLAVVDGRDQVFKAVLTTGGQLNTAWAGDGVEIVSLGPGDNTLLGTFGDFVVGQADGALRVAKLGPFGGMDTSFGIEGVLTPSLAPGTTISSAAMGLGELLLGGTDADGHAVVVHVPASGDPVTTATTALVGRIATFSSPQASATKVDVVVVASEEVTFASVTPTGELADGQLPASVPLSNVVAVTPRTATSAYIQTTTQHVIVSVASPESPTLEPYTPRWGVAEDRRPLVVAARPDDSAIVVGTGVYGPWVASVDADGALTNTFGPKVLRPGLLGQPIAVEVLTGGSFIVVTSAPASHVYKFAANGQPDLTYGDNGDARIPGHAGKGTAVVQPDGTTYVVDADRAWKVSAAGVVDPNFGIVSSQYGRSLASNRQDLVHSDVLPNGRLRVFRLGQSLDWITLTATGDYDPAAVHTIASTGAMMDTPAIIHMPDGSVVIAMRTQAAGMVESVLRIVHDTGGGTGTALLLELLPGGSDLPVGGAATADGGLLLATSDGAGSGFRKLRKDFSLDNGFGSNGLVGAPFTTNVESLGNDEFFAAASQGVSPTMQASVVKLLGNAPPVGTPARFVGFATPLRLIDTRGGAPLVAGSVRQFPVLAAAGIPANATALATNFALVGPTAGGGYGQLFGVGMTSPGGTSNINLRPSGGTVSSFATVRVGAARSVGIVSTRVAHAVVDVYGYWVPAATATSGRYVAEGQGRRILDTRTQLGGNRPLNANEVRTVATGRAGASAAVVNITVVGPVAAGFLQAYGATLPQTASVNFAAGEVRPNLAIIPLRADGTLRVKPSVRAHVLVDIVGYITGATASNSASGLFVAESPTRIADTRINLQQPGPRNVGSWTPFQVTGLAGVPAGAGAALISVISVGAPTAGYLSVEPGTAAPHSGTSVVNVSAPQMTASNSTVSSLIQGRLVVYTTAGGHIVLDVAGWFTA